MPLYQYIAVKADGTRKKETMEASSIERLKAMVYSNGDIAVRIKEAGVMQAEVDLSKVTIKDLAIFCEQMHSILKAGVPPADALEMVAKTTAKPKLRKATTTVVERVKGGSTLSAVLTEFPNIFPLIMVQMIRAGEASGALDEVFDRLAVQFEKSYKTQGTIKKALAYPKMILIVVALALVVVCAKVVPMFVEIFDSIGSDLPITTKFFIFLSDLFTKYWFISLICVGTIVAFWMVFSRSERGKQLICIWKLKIPLFKDLEVKTASANLARTLSTLLKAGLDYPKALAIAADTMSNVVFKEAVENIVEDVKNGILLNTAIKKTQLFPELLESMVSIGESTGNMEQMLENSANYFEEEVETATVALTSALQPIIMIVMGVFVGMLVYSIYSPMFSMYSNIG